MNVLLKLFAFYFINSWLDSPSIIDFYREWIIAPPHFSVRNFCTSSIYKSFSITSMEMWHYLFTSAPLHGQPSNAKRNRMHLLKIAHAFAQSSNVKRIKQNGTTVHRLLNARQKQPMDTRSFVWTQKPWIETIMRMQIGCARKGKQLDHECHFYNSTWHNPNENSIGWVRVHCSSLCFGKSFIDTSLNWVYRQYSLKMMTVSFIRFFFDIFIFHFIAFKYWNLGTRIK